MAAKLMSMREAVARFVPDGATVCMGTALEALIPFAAGHEIVRQGKRELSLVCPISDMLFDQLIGAGCARRVIGAWVGNVTAGLGHNYRRAMERGVPGPLAVEDHSNFTIGLALLAGSLGAPYIPTRSLLGTSLLESNPTFRQARDPWSGTPLVLVPALVPDVAILHVQRADVEGNAHCWGTLGITREAAFAAKGVILVTEDVWPTERILSDPNLVLTSSHKVVAVVYEPWGAYPSPVQGHYGRAHDVYAQYHDASRTPDGFADWLEKWVRGVPDHAALLERLGPAALDAVRARRRRPSEPLDYGY